MIKNMIIATMSAIFGVAATSAYADDVWITPDMPFFEYEFGDDFYVIERNQDNDAVIPEAFAKTSRACPPFCIQPMVVADGVETVGEVEILDYLLDYVETGRGVLVDSRVSSFYNAGTIPGAVNLPFNMFAPGENNPFFDPVLALLGAEQTGPDSWDFSNAKHMLVFCNGPWCGQSPQAIRNLLSIGYPAEKLHYYRGGMQSWNSLGLTVQIPGGES